VLEQYSGSIPETGSNLILKIMPYNKSNRLLRIIEIQEITKEHLARGTTERWVYKNIIYPRYFISERTFYQYLGIPAKAQLKKLQS
jgi:hypothetical protein